MILNYSQLRQVWLTAAQGTKYATSSWANLMAAIGLAESGGRTDATNPNDNGGTQTSWGTWQISLGNHSEPSPNWANPYVNARLAIGKLNSQGLSAWGTYTSGAYKQFLGGRAQPTPPQVGGSGSGGGGGGGNTLTGFNPAGSILSGLLGALGLGSAKDMMIRLGLILLGGALVIVGIAIMVGKTAAQTAVTVVAPETKAAQVASGGTAAAARKTARDAANS